LTQLFEPFNKFFVIPCTLISISDTRCLLSAWMTCGRVAFAPYFPPSSDKLASACTKMLSLADCVILQNHGVVTIGSSLQEAFDRFVTLENLAQTIINAIPIGIPQPLKESISDMKEQRNTKYQKFLRPVPQCPHAESCCLTRIITGCEKETRTELCRFVKRAYQHNIFTSSSGSISIRVPSLKNANKNDEISYLVTPTNVDREIIDPSNICFISNLHCKQKCCVTSVNEEEETNTYIAKMTKTVCFHPNQSHIDILPSHASEIHQTIYSMHPEVNCIIIAQPLNATAFCITGKELNAAGIPESHLVLGEVKTLPFECLEEGGIMLSKTLNLSKGISTILINGFGLLSVAATPLKAYVQVEVCESICSVMLTAMRRGPPALLSNDQVKEIDVIFKNGH
jgi:L-fuculose-phosphate aldolase